MKLATGAQAGCGLWALVTDCLGGRLQGPGRHPNQCKEPGDEAVLTTTGTQTGKDKEKPAVLF